MGMSEGVWGGTILYPSKLEREREESVHLASAMQFVKTQTHRQSAQGICVSQQGLDWFCLCNSVDKSVYL